MNKKLLCGLSIFLIFFLATIHANAAPAGSIDIKTDPAGAAVTLDDITGIIYTTPVTINQVTEGRHFLKIRKEGYLIKTLDLVVDAGQTLKVYETLLPAPPNYATIQVQTNPGGAEVYIDNVLKGETGPGQTLYVHGISDGPHMVLIIKDGYRDYTENIVADFGKSPNYVSIKADLKPVSVLTTLSVPGTTSTAPSTVILPLSIQTQSYGQTSETPVVTETSNLTLTPLGTTKDENASPSPTRSGLPVSVGLLAIGSLFFFSLKRD